MPHVEHRIFLDPDEPTKLWRYMADWKFESLIDREALFFCRADVFSDPFEGASPESEVEHRIEAQREVADAVDASIDEETIRRNVESLEWLQESLTQSVILNCWHASEHESDAMWRLYLKDRNGVAIQSTPKRLQESLERTEYDVYAGEVRYLDYEEDIYHDYDEFPVMGYNAMTPFVHKRKFFAHENEYRAIVDLSNMEGGPAYEWSGEENKNGKFIKVDLETLIEKIIVPPHAEDDFLEFVKQKVESADLSADVDRSAMHDEPQF